VVMARPGAFDGLDGGPGGGGNVVLVAAHEPIDVDALVARTGAGGGSAQVRVIAGADALRAFVGDAPFLTDDLAPVDQLIGR